MKKKTYEKMDAIWIFILVFFLVESIYSFLFFYKIQTYKSIQGIITNHSILIYLNPEDREKIYANNILYIDGEKYKYQVIDLEEVESYYKIELVLNKRHNYSLNDVITMSIKDKKIKMIEVFHIILEGD